MSYLAPLTTKITQLSYLALMTTSITQLSVQLGHLLAARHAHVTAAESCTGGGIAEAITRIPGSSAWFDFGFVTYSNQAKSQLLGVPPDVISAHGAVSEPVVLAMVEGAKKRAGAEFAVAVSGIAGPDGGTAAKPVGTVWLAWSGPQSSVAQKFLFAGTREEIRRQAVERALIGLIEWVESTV